MSTPVSTYTEESCFRACSKLPTGTTDSTINKFKNVRSIGRATEDYEAILNEGMKNLTFDQIQHEQEVLHGVADENDLSENAVNSLLLSLEEHLNRKKTGTAYEKAEQRSQSYIYSKELRMAFLRASRNDPKESAEKMIKFFKHKQDLFGDECLVRDITSKDLNSDDRKCLLEGYFQYSPFRDRSGRLVCLSLPGVRSKTPIRAELRARFYIWANNLETIVDVSRGIVTVNYHVSQYEERMNGSGFVEVLKLFYSLPLNVVGNHICTDSKLEGMLTSSLLAMMPHHLRVKTRIHFGSHTECQYFLASYGIIGGSLPLVGPNNEMDLSHHHAWYQQRILQEQQQQQQQDTVEEISTPQRETRNIDRACSENDVFCLGKVVKSVGNERFQTLARRYLNSHSNHQRL